MDWLELLLISGASMCYGIAFSLLIKLTDHKIEQTEQTELRVPRCTHEVSEEVCDYCYHYKNSSCTERKEGE